MSQESSGMIDFFRLLPETYSGGIYLFEIVSGKLLFTNEYFQKTFGVSGAQDLTAKSELLSLIHKEDKPLWQSQTKSLTQSPAGTRVEFDIRFLLEKGEHPRWFHFNEKSVNLSQVSDQILGIGYVNDVTNQKINEDNIREQIQFSVSLFENASLGMALQDWEGGYFRVNARFTEITGYSIEDLTYLNMKRVNKIGLSKEEKDYFSLMGDGMEFGESVLYRKDGRRINIYRRTNIFRNSEGRPNFYYLLLDDLTEKKQIESYNLHSQKMETIGNLAGNLAHDLNNYLQPIHVFSQLGKEILSKQDLATSKDKLSDYLEKIGMAANSARSMIHRIIRFSKKNDEEAISIVEISSILESNIPILLAEIPKNVQLECSFSFEPLFVKIDPVRICKLIGELVIGSVFPWEDKKEGLIHLSTKQIPWSQADSLEDRVLISLEFTGLAVSNLSINDFMQKSIFEEEEIKWKGLHLLNRYVKNWGGEVRLEKNTETGLILSIDLPLEKEISVAPVPLPNMNSGNTGSHWDIVSKKKIWIVEDDEPARESIATVLSLKNIEPILFESSIAALEYSKQELPDFVLSDYRMKDINGLNLIRKLKEKAPNLSAVLYTGNAEGVDLETLEKEGILVRTKPISIDELYESILLSFGLL
ncbi:PAS domain S-box protein [Leptospira kobayashii]|nr:PAS domain S-box protein [Leptospira kobayashii]